MHKTWIYINSFYRFNTPLSEVCGFYFFQVIYIVEKNVKLQFRDHLIKKYAHKVYYMGSALGFPFSNFLTLNTETDLFHSLSVLIDQGPVPWGRVKWLAR